MPRVAFLARIPPCIRHAPAAQPAWLAPQSPPRRARCKRGWPRRWEAPIRPLTATTPPPASQCAAACSLSVPHACAQPARPLGRPAGLSQARPRGGSRPVARPRSKGGAAAADVIMRGSSPLSLLAAWRAGSCDCYCCKPATERGCGGIPGGSAGTGARQVRASPPREGPLSSGSLSRSLAPPPPAPGRAGFLGSKPPPPPLQKWLPCTVQRACQIECMHACMDG